MEGRLDRRYILRNELYCPCGNGEIQPGREYHHHSMYDFVGAVLSDVWSSTRIECHGTWC